MSWGGDEREKMERGELEKEGGHTVEDSEGEGGSMEVVEKLCVWVEKRMKERAQTVPKDRSSTI